MHRYVIPSTIHNSQDTETICIGRWMNKEDVVYIQLNTEQWSPNVSHNIVNQPYFSKKENIIEHSKFKGNYANNFKNVFNIFTLEYPLVYCLPLMLSIRMILFATRCNRRGMVFGVRLHYCPRLTTSYCIMLLRVHFTRVFKFYMKLHMQK